MRAVRGAVRGGAVVLAMAAAGYTLPAHADPSYPPPVSYGEGRVVPSRVELGECATFSGDGFAAGATVRVTDNGRTAGTTTARHDGSFSQAVCFDGDARPGRHVLEGRGAAAPAEAPAEERVVTATCVVTGASESRGSGGGDVTVLPQRIDRAGGPGTSGGETSTGGQPPGDTAGSGGGGSGGGGAGEGPNALGPGAVDGPEARQRLAAFVSTLTGIGLLGLLALLTLVAERRRRRLRRQRHAQA